MFIVLIFCFGLIFGFIGLRGLKTGVAMLQGYRFRRDENYGLFITVTGMWFSGAALCFAGALAGIIGFFVP